MAASAAELKALASKIESAPFGFNSETRIAVAVSGGVDSVFLLAALCRLGYSKSLRVLHIDHGLHIDSSRWSTFCRTLSEAYGVPFSECAVVVDDQGSRGIEAAARAARYEALAEMLEPGEVLLTAHHADDQLETQLYRLLRGTGVKGMRSISEYAKFGSGSLARPLLGMQRAKIRELAALWELQWLEDPSNADLRFDRNWLRQAVLPQLLERWPQAASAAQRLALAADDAVSIMTAMAEIDAQGIQQWDRLPLDLFTPLDAARRRNLLRHALDRLLLPMPSAAQLGRIEELLAQPAGGGAVQWPGGAARVYAGALFLLPPLADAAGLRPQQLADSIVLDSAAGTLELMPSAGAGLPNSWVNDGLVVRFRQGGERFQPAGGERALALKEWCRQARIVPWMRDRLPLIYRGGELVAIADICLGEIARQASQSERAWRVVWRNHPRIR